MATWTYQSVWGFRKRGFRYQSPRSIDPLPTLVYRVCWEYFNALNRSQILRVDCSRIRHYEGHVRSCLEIAIREYTHRVPPPIHALFVNKANRTKPIIVRRKPPIGRDGCDIRCRGEICLSNWNLEEFDWLSVN